MFSLNALLGKHEHIKILNSDKFNQAWLGQSIYSHGLFECTYFYV